MMAQMPRFHAKTKPKPNANPKPKLSSFRGLGLVLGFGLVCSPLGKNIVGSFFWSSLLPFFLFPFQVKFCSPYG